MWLQIDLFPINSAHRPEQATESPGTVRSGDCRSARVRRWGIFTFCIGLVFVQGCGFHLRGTFDVPPRMDPSYIQAPQGDPLARQLREALRSADVQVVDTPDEASAVLRLLKQEQSRRVRAVDRRGKVIDYELSYEVMFDVQDGKGEELVSAQTITLVRTQVNPGVEVLGKAEEQALFFTDMQRDLAGRILRRLQKQLR